MIVQPRSAYSSSSSSSLPEGYKADPKQDPMLRYQASLPNLPVPPLSSTLAKYLESIRPHLTSAEYARSEATVREFGASPRAAELQKRLEARAAEPGTVNWIADWWNDAAYMAYRDPVVVNVSYFFVHMADPTIQDAPKRAATLIKAMLPFRTLVERCVLLALLGFHFRSLTYTPWRHRLAPSWSPRKFAAHRSVWIRTNGCESHNVPLLRHDLCFSRFVHLVQIPR